MDCTPHCDTCSCCNLCPICEKNEKSVDCTVTTEWKKYRGLDGSHEYELCIDCWDMLRGLLSGEVVSIQFRHSDPEDVCITNHKHKGDP